MNTSPAAPKMKRVYADLPEDVVQSMKEISVQLRITIKKFLEQSIAHGVAAAKAAIAADKKAAKSKKGN
jgi:hypothetical protein